MGDNRLVYMIIFVHALSLSGLRLITASNELNNRPIIGVLAETTAHTYKKQYGDMFIYSSYVSYIESAGARVVPILDSKPDAYYKKLFNSINGMMLPGGGVSISNSSYSRAGKIMFALALKANDAGDYFPIWATCLGFEMLSYFIAGKDLLASTDSENLILPLDFTKDFKNSRLFGSMPADIFQIMRKKDVTVNNHQYGLTPKAFYKDPNLPSFFHVLSTNKDRNGKEFISTYEAYKYPVYATQWHPEKNAFIWAPKFHWLHTASAIRAVQYFADFFINEARKSQHQFPNMAAAMAAVIENFERVFLGSHYPFETMYVFNNSKHTHEKWMTV